MKLRQTLILLALSAAPVSAQVVITASDVGAHLMAGNTITQVKDTLTATLDIGGPGATTWDFSGLQAHTTMELTCVDPGTAPHIALFPGSTHALKSKIDGPYPGAPGPVTADVYMYYTLGDRLERRATMGDGVANSGPPYYIPFPASLRNTYTPLDTTYVFPLSYGVSWGSSYVDTLIVFVLGSPYLTTISTHNFTYSVDAHGTMKMPGGATYDALRIRRIETGPTPYLVYIFIAKNGASVTVTAADTAQPLSGTIQIAPKSTTWNLPAVPLPVQLSFFRAALSTGASDVTLSWATLSEKNNYGFEIERRAGSAGVFETLPGAFIPGNGTTIVPHSYSYQDAGVPRGTWYYRLRQIDLDGTVNLSEPQRVDVTTEVVSSELPATLFLAQNYPNPFNASSRISYEVPGSGRILLVVTDLLGREIQRLRDGAVQAGRYQLVWTAEGLPSGTYFLRLQWTPLDAGGSSRLLTRRMVLLR